MKPFASDRCVGPEFRIIILGAGRHVRGDLPAAVLPTTKSTRVLDWILSAFSVLPNPEISFVGGFAKEKILERYPDMRFYFNPEWEQTGALGSLSKAPLKARTAIYVCYSDIVFRDSVIMAMEECGRKNDVVIAADTRWCIRYEGRGRSELKRAEKLTVDDSSIVRAGRQLEVEKANAEFAGILRLSPQASAVLNQALAAAELSPRGMITEAVEYLCLRGFHVAYVDTHGQWAELNAPQDLAQFILGTKAESLARLKPHLTRAVIGELLCYTHERWKREPSVVTSEIQARFPDTTLIIRSSALSEDSWKHSGAGENESVANVPSRDALSLIRAIDRVFDSYQRGESENQVLVQEMVADVGCSGVVMTRTPGLTAPYYVINFDDSTGRTDQVTSGGGGTRVFYLLRTEKPEAALPPEIASVIAAVREIEELVGHDSLDIEFAITKAGLVHILQVRPIVASVSHHRVDDAAVFDAVARAREWFSGRHAKFPFVRSMGNVLNVMSDWNPAEIIGRKPKRLAFSLYRYLITDETWATQRAEYGYKDVRPCPLVVDVAGHPYIDIRGTFSSFVPAAVPEELGDRLVDYYINYLSRHPELYDKVEFEVLYTCLAFDFEQQASRLRQAGFTDEEVTLLQEALKGLTWNGIQRYRKDLSQVARFEERFSRIEESELPPLERAFHLLEDVRRLGALHFAHLARNGFVAMTLLRSMRNTAMISPAELDAFLSSLHTVSRQFQEDAWKVRTGQLSPESFVKYYGHLRPGTYDITSPRYDHAPEKYLLPIVEKAEQPRVHAVFQWSKAAARSIEAELAKKGWEISIEDFNAFLKGAIEGREYSKFSFTRNLSRALEDIARYGEGFGLSRDNLAHLRIEDLLSLRWAPCTRPAELLKEQLRRGQEEHELTQTVCLPAQIFSSQDFAAFEQLKSEPNFVTQKQVRAEIVDLSACGHQLPPLQGKIVLIPNADPGYDWIFAQSVAGLITMYGGANSHMAVRSAEFQLPAAIGIGEALYEEIQSAYLVDLDCASRKIFAHGHRGVGSGKSSDHDSTTHSHLSAGGSPRIAQGA